MLPAEAKMNFYASFSVSLVEAMDMFEKLVKTTLLSVFCFLNAVDMVQTLAFIRMGIEGNLFVVHYPLLWAVLKASFTFGLPPILYLVDVYLNEKTDEDDESLFWYMKRFITMFYVIIFLADIYFLLLVSKNISILGRLLP